VANLLWVLDSKNTAADYAMQFLSYSSRTELLTTKESVKEIGLIEITVEKYFYS
jgi:hypothetical protein